MKLITDIKIVRNDDSRVGEKSWTIQILRQEVIVKESRLMGTEYISTHALTTSGQPEVEEIVIGPF